MALPLIAAGIAARVVAKKLASRAVGGIVGTGAKSVNPVYRNTNSVKVLEKTTDSKLRQKIINSQRTSAINDAKSGESAKRLGSLREQNNSFVNNKKLTVKINSNPTRAK